MKRLLSLMFLLVLMSVGQGHAQTGDPEAVPASTATAIQLDHSAIALNGIWKFHIGDSPKIADSQEPLWAQPDYDDSGWQDYTIDYKNPGLTAEQAIQSAELPGWQQHGHPGYTGYAWYRIRLQIAPGTHSLALLMPQYFEDAYEIFINGRKIGGSGTPGEYHVVYLGPTKLFPVPAAVLDRGQSVTLAIRFWNLRYESLPSVHNLDGGLRGVPLWGSRNLLQVFQQSQQEQTWKTLWSQWLLVPLYGAVGIVSLFLFLFSRSQREYLWTGISLTSGAIEIAAIAISQQITIPMQLADVVWSITDCITFFALPLAAMYLLGVARPRWCRINYLVLALFLARDLGRFALQLGLLPPTVALDRFVNKLFPLSIFVFSLLVLAIAVDGVRTMGRKAWLPLAPGMLFACGVIMTGITRYSGSLLIPDFLFVCVPLLVFVIFLMRFTEQQRDNIRLVDDMRQAQTVQQMLIPLVAPHTPGFAVESVYLPASEVGGDFFHVQPADDGSLLIVVGDVSGKGLKAAMTVSTIVGALRAYPLRAPAEVLANLNRMVHGQIKGFVTCCATLIAADGKVTIANAGHLSPYRNGKEMAVEGGLPLGILAEDSYAETKYQLAPGDRLTFVSDGVVEATNDKRELFGFERTQQISNQPAAAIADTAKHFGQEDDITVVGIQFAGVPETVTL